MVPMQITYEAWVVVHARDAEEAHEAAEAGAWADEHQQGRVDWVRMGEGRRDG